MQFLVREFCDCFQHGVRVMACQWKSGLVYSSCIVDTFVVCHHSHKIVVPSALGRLVSERNNNSFSSVNPPSWGLYCIQLTLCQICGECEAFDCCKLVCYRYIDKFVLVFVSRKEGQTTTRTFYFNINRPISDLIFLRRCIKFNPPIRVRFSVNRVLSNAD